MTFIEEHLHSHTKKQNVFDLIPSQTAFWIGFAAAILCTGTIGFILLSSCILTQKCTLGGLGLNSTNSKQVAINNPSQNENDNTAPSVPSGTVPVVTADDHVRGDKNAKVTMIEYSDFQCPYCGAFDPTITKVFETYKGKVRWVYRHFPLSFHPNAEPAALASECAGEQGKFWEFLDLAFKNQDALGPDFYTKFATDNKLDLNKFNDCISSQKYLKKVQDQAQAGGTAGIDGTPGTFLIGKDGSATPIKGAVPFETLKAAVDKLLK